MHVCMLAHILMLLLHTPLHICMYLRNWITTVLTDEAVYKILSCLYPVGIDGVIAKINLTPLEGQTLSAAKPEIAAPVH